ncbi:hypothetical protein ON010_g14083 [Phytophthora cinnamomi]|nr:hypothetical protein ON010_g14083 [Phytophthora cinnamomi]
MPKFLLTCAIVFSAGLAVTDSVVGAALSVEHGLRGENASLAGSDVGDKEEKFPDHRIGRESLGGGACHGAASRSALEGPKQDVTDLLLAGEASTITA